MGNKHSKMKQPPRMQHSWTKQRAMKVCFGYLRHLDKTINTDWVLPKEIVDICSLYFFIREAFIECGNDRIKFSNERRTVWNEPKEGDFDHSMGMPNWSNTAYGSYEIDCNNQVNKNRIFIWKFELISRIREGLSCNVTIGIAETTRNNATRNFAADTNTISYAYDNIGNCYSGGKLILIQRRKIINPEGTLTMTLDIAKRKIIFQKRLQVDYRKKNELHVQEIDNVITTDVKYCLAAHVLRGSRVRLINFIIQ